jgi:hypothetical protein
VVGFARQLPRVLLRDEAWRRDTELHPASSALTRTALIVLWPVCLVSLAWRMAAKQRSRRG